MEYAIQLLVPILLGLWVGQAASQWLLTSGHGHYDWLTVLGCLVGFAMGLTMMYQRLMLNSKPAEPHRHDKGHDGPLANNTEEPTDASR